MSEWNSISLSDVCNIAIGGTPSRNVEKYWAEDEGYPWVAISDLKGRVINRTAEKITRLGAQNSNAKAVSKGTVIMSFKLSIGKVAYAGMDLYTNEAIASFQLDKESIDTDYFYYQIPDLASSAITDSAIKGATLNKEKLNSLVISFPPLKQQQKIAKILSTVDNLIESTQNLIDKYTAIKQGMMADLFTRGIDLSGSPETNPRYGQLRPSVEDAPELYKETELGWVPRGWDVVELSEVVDQNRPIVYGILMPGTGVADGVPVIKVKDIKGGAVIEGGLLVTSHEIDRQYRRSKVKPGDLLYTIRGTVGRLAKVTESLAGANITQDTARIAITKGDEDFYMAYLDSHNCKVFAKINTLGVAVQGINLGALRKMPVVSPPALEQRLIKEKSVGIERLIAKESLYVKELRNQKKGLMQDLLTGKVKVR